MILTAIVVLLGYWGLKGLITNIPCGGFGNVPCSAGYRCQNFEKYSDAMGKCVKNIFGEKPDQLPTVNPTIVTPGQEPTVDWITYTDKVNGFEIKYPSKFTPLAGKPGQYVFALNETTKMQQRLSVLPDITMRAIARLSGQDYRKILIEDVVFDGSGLPPKSFSEFLPKVLGDNTFYYIQTGLFEGILSGSYYFVSDDRVYVFTYTSSPVDWTNSNFRPDDDTLKNDLEQVLKTFKTGIQLLGWKRYENSRFGFSFQYPEKSVVSELNLNPESLDHLMNLSIKTNENSDNSIDPVKTREEFLSVGIDLYVNKPSKSLSEYILENACFPQYPDFDDTVCRKKTKQTIKPFSVNKISGETVDVVPYEVPTSIYVFGSQDKVFVITLWGYETGVPTESNKKELLQLLSTFKFLDQKQIDETTNWRTYSNKQWGFEFNYPNNYLVTNGRGQYFINTQPAIELESERFNLYTNSLEALFTVTVKPNGKSDCEYVPRGNFDNLQERLINGVKFSQFFNTGAAAGTKYSNTILHHLKGTTCYEIAATIVEGSDGGSPEGISKIEQQKEVLATQLDQIISTFIFTNQTGITPTTNPEGRFCGGIAANLPENQCPTGYRCQLDGSHPDASGICVKQ